VYRTRVAAVVAVLVGSLVLSGSVAAKPSAKQRGKAAIGDAVRARDFTKTSTGDVAVSRCATKRRGGRVTAVVCRVSVQRIFAGGSYKRCVDRAVRARPARNARNGFRLVRSSYLNAGGFSCKPRVNPTPPPISDPGPPAGGAVPPTEELPAPPPADVPVGLPAGLPPLPPFFPGASQATATAATLAARRATGAVKARAAQSTWYEHYGYTPYFELPQYPGVTWTVGSWRYNSTTCNWYPMYYEWWWYGYNSVTGQVQWTQYTYYWAEYVYPNGWNFWQSPRC
jgi:hypothetical protein